MKRWLFGLLIAITLAGMGVPAHAAANDFTIRSFAAEYYLGKDHGGRSTLKAVEKITADFPNYDQNHGIERAIPKEYDGHMVNLQIESVTDENGGALSYSISSDGGNEVLRIGDSDTYVHGTKQYVITYSERDVTKFFVDTGDDELYWDVNGTEWAVPMRSVSAKVHVASELTSNLNGKTSCYQGARGSTMPCQITSMDVNGEKVFMASAKNLNSHENMTFAIGFSPHTFAAYQQTWQEKLFATVLTIWMILLAITSAAAIVILIWLIMWYRRVMTRIKGKGMVVPEYLPPKNASVLISALLLKNTRAALTAQLLDLAVRHYVKLYQTKEKKLLKPAEYELEIVKDPSNLREEEKRLLRDLFGGNMTVGARFALKRLQDDYSFGKKLLASRKKLVKDTRTTYGLFERAKKEARQFKVAAIVLLIVSLVTLSPFLFVTSIVAFIFVYALWPLTAKGVDLKEYLAGLKLYITVAEKDRIRMLQSPEGAEKIGETVGDDAAQLVKLYERVLPYAVLFGVEKEWTKQLGVYYETSHYEPDWYSGQGAFNAVVFSSALSDFNSQSMSYSSPSNSSSGGSGGGGFSGGGGGGGGGGGW